MMSGIEQHCPQYHCIISEDCGQRDGTTDFITKGRVGTAVPELLSTKHVVESGDANFINADVYTGDVNLGVTGNNNRLLKLFMDGEWDHLLLCDDDLLVTGDFVEAYANAHADLGVDMFCFCDFTEASPAISGAPETYKWTTYPMRGYQVKFLPRFTGIMMSVTRSLIEKIGYMDAEFGKFGEEHCDWTIRARMAGGIRLNNTDMNCLDIAHNRLTHQNVQTSMSGSARKHADQEAHVAMQRAAYEYRLRHYYRPFRLTYPVMAAGHSGVGVPCRQLDQIGYRLVNAPA
jgi:hypothetical protein